eukprot:sb/3464048/
MAGLKAPGKPSQKVPDSGDRDFSKPYDMTEPIPGRQIHPKLGVQKGKPPQSKGISTKPKSTNGSRPKFTGKSRGPSKIAPSHRTTVPVGPKRRGGYRPRFWSPLYRAYKPSVPREPRWYKGRLAKLRGTPRRFIRPGVSRLDNEGCLFGRDNQPVRDMNGRPIFASIQGNGEPRLSPNKELLDRDGRVLRGPDGAPIVPGRGLYGPRISISGCVYSWDGSVIVGSNKRPLKVGFLPDGRVRVGRYGDLRCPNNSRLRRSTGTILYVCDLPYVGIKGLVYRPDGTPIKNCTAKVDKVTGRPNVDTKGRILDNRDSPLRDEYGVVLVLGPGPIVFRGMVMLPVGRPLLSTNSIVVVPGEEEGLPAVDENSCILDSDGELVEGRDGNGVVLADRLPVILEEVTLSDASAEESEVEDQLMWDDFLYQFELVSSDDESCEMVSSSPVLEFEDFDMDEVQPVERLISVASDIFKDLVDEEPLDMGGLEGADEIETMPTLEHQLPETER